MTPKQKEKAIATINTLKSDILEGMKGHEATKLYINTWVLGYLDLLTDKINKNIDFYFRSWTYSHFIEEIKGHLYCERIDPQIEQETREVLLTETNKANFEIIKGILTR